MPLASSSRFATDGLDQMGSGLGSLGAFGEQNSYENIAKFGVQGAAFELLQPISMRSSPLIFGMAIEKKHLEKFWVWLERDGAPEYIGQLKEKILKDPKKADQLIAMAFKELVKPLQDQLEAAHASSEFQRRLTIQLGGFDVFEAFPLIITAFKNIDKLRAAKDLAAHVKQYETEEEFSDLVEAIELPSGSVQKLWCTAFVYHMAWPGKFMLGVLDHCFGDTESAVRKSGYGPYGDAMIINLQQLVDTIEEQAGVFSDIDLMCLAIDRYHRIARVMHYYLELGKSSQWNHCLEVLTSRVSKVLEKRLSQVVPNVTNVLRTPTQNAQILFTTDQVLQAYNSVYLLDAARNAKESLAVNNVVERTWNELGKSLEILLERALEDQKAAAFGDSLAIAKVDIAIKLCAIRFGAEYAQIMSKNKDNIERRKLNNSVSQ